MEFSRQEYWSGLPFPLPGGLPVSGTKPRYPAVQADSLPSEPPGNQGGKRRKNLFITCHVPLTSCVKPSIFLVCTCGCAAKMTYMMPMLPYRGSPRARNWKHMPEAWGKALSECTCLSCQSTRGVTVGAAGAGAYARGVPDAELPSPQGLVSNACVGLPCALQGIQLLPWPLLTGSQHTRSHPWQGHEEKTWQARQTRTSGIPKSCPGVHLKDDICLSDACCIRLLPNFCDTGRRPSLISFQTGST